MISNLYTNAPQIALENDNQKRFLKVVMISFSNIRNST